MIVFCVLDPGNCVHNYQKIHKQNQLETEQFAIKYIKGELHKKEEIRHLIFILYSFWGRPILDQMAQGVKNTGSSDEKQPKQNLEEKTTEKKGEDKKDVGRPER